MYIQNYKTAEVMVRLELDLHAKKAFGHTSSQSFPKY